MMTQQFRAIAQRVYYRLCKHRDYWHNRRFHSCLDIEEASPEEVLIRWQGDCVCVARPAHLCQPLASRCHIIASGPSIKSIRKPARLFESPTICVNGSFRIAEDLGCRASYYMVSDWNYIESQFPLFCRGVETSDALLLHAGMIDTIFRQDPEILRGKTVYFYQDMRIPYRRNRIHPKPAAVKRWELLVHPDHDVAYSTNLAFGIYPSQTVVYNAVQFALGIGYDEVCLFGMDLTGGKRFFAEKDPPPSFIDRTYEESIEPSFELVRRYCEESPQRVLNCSLESRLPASVLPKVDPNQVLDAAARDAA